MKGLTGWARCPGTCGEWVQGAKNGVPFLIGCPVNRFVQASVEIQKDETRQSSPYFQKDNLRLGDKAWCWTLPNGKEKTYKVLNKLAQKVGLPPLKSSVEIFSELPVGKGMASSTADMTASMVAVLQAFQIPWEAKELARLALEVEPTDPVMFEGITEFAHRDGSYINSLGPVLPANLLMLDGGGILDTQVFNARNELEMHYRKNESRIRKALVIFYEGMEKRDLEKIAYASTVSACCNQEINPKPQFGDFRSWIFENGGLGVVTAHSGTLLAGIFPENISLAVLNALQAEAQARFQAESVEWVQTHNGGVEGGVSHARWESISGHGEVRKEIVY